jgi:hypothetical protein
MIQKIPAEGLRGISFPPEAFHELSDRVNTGRNVETSGYSSSIILLSLRKDPGRRIMHDPSCVSMQRQITLQKRGVTHAILV